MQFLLMIYAEEARWKTLDPKERDAVLQEYLSFTKGIAESGHYRGGNELHPTPRAKTVRLRKGKQTKEGIKSVRSDRNEQTDSGNAVCESRSRRAGGRRGQRFEGSKER